MFQNIEIMGHTVRMYDFWNVVSTAVMFAYLVWQTRKYRGNVFGTVSQSFPNLKMQVSMDEVITITAVAFILFKELNPAFADWFTQGNANYYGSLTAWFIAITVMPLLYRINPFYVHDMFAPALPIQLFLAKIACFFAGCCSGFEMPNSWYFNWDTGRHEFPVQLVEALVALALYVFLRRYQKRSRIPGSVFPVYLVLYAVSRFATEFLRGDLPSVFGILNAYQILSVVYALLGGVLLGAVWAHHRWASRRTEASAAACHSEDGQS